MTLVEVAFVVCVLGLIATGVAVAVVPRLVRARAEEARVDAVTLAQAALAYRDERAGHDCPTVEALVRGGFLSARIPAADPWGHAFALDCGGPEPTVRSAGADGAFGTSDDVSTSP
ncbi:MAG: type II secretion system protein GspG [Polyangiales bacterium]